MFKSKKILIILINFILILFLVSTIVYGDLLDTFEEQMNPSSSGAQEVADKAGKIVGIIQVVGTIVSLGMLMVIGIRYMLGSAEEKAEYKKTMQPYLIGSVLIFGTVNIAQIVYDWAKSI